MLPVNDYNPYEVCIKGKKWVVQFGRTEQKMSYLPKSTFNPDNFILTNVTSLDFTLGSNGAMECYRASIAGYQCDKRNSDLPCLSFCLAITMIYPYILSLTDYEYSCQRL